MTLSLRHFTPAITITAAFAVFLIAAQHPSLAANPCEVKNPCAANPCEVKNPCAANPCAANPCAANPCKAKNPCAANPCAANPCAPAPTAELSDREAASAYRKISKQLRAGYAKSGIPTAKSYFKWRRYNRVPYVSETHGGRFVNNYANKKAKAYKKFEKAGVMPVRSVLAKDSFRVTPQGKVQPGPLFVMEKMNAGFSPDTGNWRFTLVMPDGKIFGTTNGVGSRRMAFCDDCHRAVADSQDHLFFLPEKYRK